MAASTKTLRQSLEVAQGPLPLKAALEVMRDLLALIAARHREGRAHGGVVPEIVIVSADAPAKIEGVEVSDEVLARYLAPERESSGPATPPADVYAFGCLAYEVLTGRPPFIGAPPAVLAQHVHAAPKAPSAFHPEVPAELDRLVLRLITKTPHDRPSAIEALGELEALMRSASRDSARASPNPRARRIRLALIAFAACLALAIVIPRVLHPSTMRIAVVALTDEASTTTIAWPLAHQIAAEIDATERVPTVSDDGIDSARLSIIGSDRPLVLDPKTLDRFARAVGAELVLGVSVGATPHGPIEARVRTFRPGDRVVGAPLLTRELGGFAVHELASRMLDVMHLGSAVPSPGAPENPASLAAEALASSGSIGCAAGRYDRCETMLRAAIEAHGDDPRFHLVLARALAHQHGRGEEATAEIGKALALRDHARGRHTKLWLDAEEAWRSAEIDPAKADQITERIVAIDESRAAMGSNPWALLHAAEAVLRFTDDRERPLALFARARRMAPANYAAVRSEAELAGGHSEDPDARRRAAQILWKAIACEPRSPIAPLLEHDAVLWNLAQPQNPIACDDAGN